MGRLSSNIRNFLCCRFAEHFQYFRNGPSMGLFIFDRLDFCLFQRSILEMKNQIRPTLTLFVLFTLLTGVFYPLLVTGISQVFFPKQANGSLIEVNGVSVGSELIGQNFTGMQYFWGRPSATSENPYNAFDQETLTGSSGSNFGPLSQALFNSMQERIDYLHKADPEITMDIPIDLVTNSGSGLDPHVYVESAYLQIPRVARNRGMSEQALTNLVDQFFEKPLFGDAYVNILMLNHALDGIKLNK